MPTRKIADMPLPDQWRRVCTHPEHNPPSMMVYQPGVYEHTCPGCGRRVTFTVPMVWWSTKPLAWCHQPSDDDASAQAYRRGRATLPPTL